MEEGVMRLILIILLCVLSVNYAVAAPTYSCPSAQWISENAIRYDAGGMLSLDLKYKGMYYHGKTNIKYTTGDFNLGKLVKVRLYGASVNCIYRKADKENSITNNGDTWGAAYFVNGKSTKDCKAGEQVCIPGQTGSCEYIVCEIGAVKK